MFLASLWSLGRAMTMGCVAMMTERNPHGISRRGPKKSDVEASFRQLLELPRSLHCRKREADQRMRPAILRDRRRHQPRARRRRRVADFDAPHFAASGKPCYQRGLLRLPQSRSSLLKKAGAGIRECHVSLCPREQEPRLIPVQDLGFVRSGMAVKYESVRPRARSAVLRRRPQNIVNGAVPFASPPGKPAAWPGWRPGPPVLGKT